MGLVIVMALMSRLFTLFVQFVDLFDFTLFHVYRSVNIDDDAKVLF